MYSFHILIYNFIKDVIKIRKNKEITINNNYIYGYRYNYMIKYFILYFNFFFTYWKNENVRYSNKKYIDTKYILVKLKLQQLYIL